MIVKIQRPLAGDLSNLLVYDKERTFELLVPVMSSEGKWLLNCMRDKPKIYCVVQVDKDRVARINHIMADQDW